MIPDDEGVAPSVSVPKRSQLAGKVGDGGESMMVLAACGAPQIGRVESFDEPRGLGVISGPGESHLDFHCTALDDGTRTVEAGREVAYRVGPGLLGRWEAVRVTKLSPGD